MSSSRPSDHSVWRVMPSARGRSPPPAEVQVARTSASSSSDVSTASDASQTNLGFDDEECWLTSAPGFQTAVEDDVYGTRHLELPHTPWRDEPYVTASVASAQPGDHSVDHGRPPIAPNLSSHGRSASMSSMVAFHAFHRTPTTVWKAYRSATADERSPASVSSASFRSTHLASSPPGLSQTPSPLSTPFRGRILSLGLSSDEVSEDEDDQAPIAPLTFAVRQPASSPMVRSPPVVYDFGREGSSSISASPVVHFDVFNSTAVAESPAGSVRWLRKGSTSKVKPSKAAAGRGPSKMIETQVTTGFIRTYKNGKGMHSCEGCRKARHKCVGANAPPNGQAGVSEQRCQRCENRDIDCVFEVLQTRGSCKRYKELHARLAQAGQSDVMSPTAKPQRAPRSHARGSSASTSTRPLRSQARVGRKRVDYTEAASDLDESDRDVVGYPAISPRDITRSTTYRSIEHTYIPDPVGDVFPYVADSPASRFGSRRASSASSSRSVSCSASGDDLIDPTLAPMTSGLSTSLLSLTDGSSSATDGDDPVLPLSPPSYQGSLPIRLDSTNGLIYPTEPGALPVGINTDAIRATPAGRPTSEDGSDSVRSLSALAKHHGRSREPSSSSTILGRSSEGEGEPTEGLPVASSPSWLWCGRSQASPPAHP